MRHFSFLILIIILFSCNYSNTKVLEEKVWEIKEYRISQRKCSGPGGSGYYILDITKEGELFGVDGYYVDSCIIRFRVEPKDNLEFDTCNLTIRNN